VTVCQVMSLTMTLSYISRLFYVRKNSQWLTSRKIQQMSLAKLIIYPQSCAFMQFCNSITRLYVPGFSVFFSARCNIYISRLALMLRCQCCLSVTEVHWRIIANLGFKFRSHFTVHCSRRAACVRIILRHASQC